LAARPVTVGAKETLQTGLQRHRAAAAVELAPASRLHPESIGPCVHQGASSTSCKNPGRGASRSLSYLYPLHRPRLSRGEPNEAPWECMTDAKIRAELVAEWRASGLLRRRQVGEAGRAAGSDTTTTPAAPTREPRHTVTPMNKRGVCPNPRAAPVRPQQPISRLRGWHPCGGRRFVGPQSRWSREEAAHERDHFAGSSTRLVRLGRCPIFPDRHDHEWLVCRCGLEEQAATVPREGTDLRHGELVVCGSQIDYLFGLDGEGSDSYPHDVLRFRSHVQRRAAKTR
jgi:hypothetical protein